MGQRGPKKTPASVHKRRGTYREDRHGGDYPDGNVPKRPRGMSARARAEWDRLADDLAAAGLLSDRFLMTFVIYCELVADYWELRKLVAKQGFTESTSNGNVIQNPNVGTLGKCLDRLIKVERELGLTPASATGLTPGSEADEDPLEALQRKRTGGSSSGTARK